jgi:hypothetical protein
VAASRLSEAMQAAVLGQDVGTLWLAGAHPMALLYFARSCGWDNPRYYQCLSDAELRRVVPGAVEPASRPEPPQRHR